MYALNILVTEVQTEGTIFLGSSTFFFSPRVEFLSEWMICFTRTKGSSNRISVAAVGVVVIIFHYICIRLFLNYFSYSIFHIESLNFSQKRRNFIITSSSNLGSRSGPLEFFSYLDSL